MTIEEVVTKLKRETDEKYKRNVVKLGIPVEFSIGVSTSSLRKYSKAFPKEKKVLFNLWQTNYDECKILANLRFNSNEFTQEEIPYPIEGSQSWDLCDLFCKSILVKRSDYDSYITSWVKSGSLYYKRATVTLIASNSIRLELVKWIPIYMLFWSIQMMIDF